MPAAQQLLPADRPQLAFHQPCMVFGKVVAAVWRRLKSGVGLLRFVKVDMEKQKSYMPVLIGALLGAAAFCVFFFIAFFTLFSICGDSGAAEILFPYSMIVSPRQQSNVLLALFAALVQYPLYGGLLGFAWSKRAKAK